MLLSWEGLGEERNGAFVGRVVEVLATEESLEAFFFSLWREGVVEVEDAVWSESEAGLSGVVVEEEEEEEEESGSWCKQRDEVGRIRDNICRYNYLKATVERVCVCVGVGVGVNEIKNVSESESVS